MNISGAGSGDYSRAQPTQREPAGELGQDDFLKLMITQLQNQDPMNPMESGEFMSQIASFTTASGMDQLQKSFSEFQQDMRANQALQAASLVGREVLVETDAGRLPADGEMTGIVQLPSAVANANIHIHNAAGERVRTLATGEQPSGDYRFAWDGRADDGRTLPPGAYRVTASTQVEGEERSLRVMNSAPVVSVTLAGENERGPRVNLDGIGEMALSDIRRVQ
ncbi:flagellar hook assembly protein FlgD [Alkalilimnicola ehrlichii MLHE-1]|uniref:Basal-body rod modification protein FlgD n=1 Tax=Alkalilimnicola ehrlichii (strain ATCC BAA-1101 / DSM 17681 / MLHE-1) TaxID=187272 RepID=Q0AA88_ALKEH|nr:flagellar hook assembly protein FlgD [Alkalilimnicola ehrlichii]ABI56249.1 flagellar hook capping protein [Alkalilimnicola ehrlichii MLHE-1]